MSAVQSSSTSNHSPLKASTQFLGSFIRKLILALACMTVGVIVIAAIIVSIVDLVGPIDLVLMGQYLHLEVYPLPGPIRIFFNEHAIIDISHGIRPSTC